MREREREYINGDHVCQLGESGNVPTEKPVLRFSVAASGKSYADEKYQNPMPKTKSCPSFSSHDFSTFLLKSSFMSTDRFCSAFDTVWFFPSRNYSDIYLFN